MRNNQPVTQNEIMLASGQMIVSKTDLKGLITDVNRDFIETSGFREEELIGQPHNIVRHPDMPAEAFADLWRTLKAGRPWSGLVKNRCKNGDHYWVLANVTPLYQDGRVSGYMSVRTAPTRQQIDAAERAYREFREGRSAGRTIRDGAVVSARRGLSGWLKERSIRQRILAICGLLTAGMLLIGALGILAVGNGKQHLQSVYAGQVVPLKALKEVADAYAVSIVDLSHKTRDGSETWASALDKVGKAEALIGERWGSYAAGDLSEDERRLVGQASALMKNGDAAIGRLKEILRAEDQAALTAFAARELYPAIDPISDKVGELVALQLNNAASDIDVAHQEIAAFQWRLAMLLLVFAVLGILLALGLAAGIRRPIEAATRFFRGIAEGRSDIRIDVERRDELLAIADAARSMQIKAGVDLNEMQVLAAEGLRIKMALDGAGTPMTIADESNQLIYMNAAAEALWRAMEPQMRERVPGFSVSQMRQYRLPDFFDDLAVKAAYSAELSEPRTLDVAMCGRSLRVTATPVRNKDGRYLGRASQWLDRTQEVAIENEVGTIVGAAARGDFSHRVAVDGKHGFFLRLASDLNTLLQTSQQSLDEIVGVLSAIAEGDLTCSVTAEYQGTFGQLKDGANRTASRLREIIERLRLSADAINVAAREIASGNQDLSSRTEEQASSLEETASSMEQLTSTVKQNADNARQANQLAENAQQVATRGGEVVAEVVHTMNDIQQASRRIADIIGVIDGIAFQTNILALNAAVEAARAGEQGRGFAVVASEVRNLAQRSAAAAKEIKLLISDSVARVESGNKLVEQAGTTMDDVVAGIRGVAGIMADIAEASREQSSGIEQVSLAVSQMDEVTQQNAALVEQAAAAAESLEEQAETLVRAVSVFRVGTASPSKPGADRSQNARRGKPALPARLDDEWEEF
ncbi:methyl-accepting chemotaxis protein [Azonexus sp. R2A61]|uniref:methyl-accepting chemotaxis protein n=1 Tax=Azonexus sp. R2A61 TaxID=2744443 RepID=UPI002646C044|nr:methyl-accepting chemotaxis protein [Azonexus sp. R2A61]